LPNAVSAAALQQQQQRWAYNSACTVRRQII